DCAYELGYYTIAFDCRITCFKNYYQKGLDENASFGGCVIYKNLKFDEKSSTSINLDNLSELNENFAFFNPWGGIEAWKAKN
ncbi:MAG: hypothetical protein PHU63_04270, partial [Candidatus ainarchaeum sp.]|nr:hypothetical protein [Candidatus ainarchaeum sp.]